MKKIHDFSIYIAYVAALWAISIDAPVTAVDKNCSCGLIPKYKWAGPYCSLWRKGVSKKFCFLSGGSNASTCPGAVQIGNQSLYFTGDGRICERSIFEHCKCGYHPKYDQVSPYCNNWITNAPSFCFLSGGVNASGCPGANRLGNESIYWTKDEGICAQSKKSILEHCKCGYHQKYDRVSSYCDNWVTNAPPFCLLSGGVNASGCPGANRWGNESIYWTRDIVFVSPEINSLHSFV